MLKYWNASYPFNDFLVCTCKKNERYNRNFNFAERKLYDLGLKNIEHIKLDEYICVTASTYTSVNPDIQTIVSGVVQYNGEFIFGQEDLSEKVGNDINESMGIFTSIYKENNKVIVSQDVFGCGLLFYADLNDCFVVSNRYHLLLLFLSWIDFKGKVNKKKLIASLYSNTTFLGQNISEDMDIIGTKQLSFKNEIEISSEGWKVKEKVDPFEHLIELSKNELLENSRKEIINNINSIVKSEKFDKYVIDLSGGFDSRAVLAAALNITGAANIFEIYTKDIPGSSDLDIAAGIKNHYKLNYYKEPGRSQYPLTFEDNLTIWRSYFMGTYYRMGLSAWSPKGTNSAQIRMSGGCGELYRTFWYKIYGSKVAGASTVEDLSSKLVNSFYRLVKLDENIKNELVDFIALELNKTPGDNPLSKLDNHYLYFRNRYHFGMRAFEYYHDSPMWFPLMSKSLFVASQRLTLEEKNNDNLMIDITHALNPTLVRFDYDSKPFDANSYLRALLGSSEGKINLNSYHEDWEEIDRSNKEIILSKRQKMSAEFYNEWKHSNLMVKSKLFNTLENLKNRDPELHSLLDPVFLASIEENINNQGFVNSMYAKLSSIKDQMDIFN